MMESKYLVFKELIPKPKTRVFDVRSKSSNEHLGEIKWHGPWRQYCFFTTKDYEQTFWSKGCLADLIKFIEKIKQKGGIANAK